MDASEGRLLPRRALRHIARCGEPLRQLQKLAPERSREEPVGRILKVSIRTRRYPHPSRGFCDQDGDFQQKLTLSIGTAIGYPTF